MRGLHRSPTDPRPLAEPRRDGVRHRRVARLAHTAAALFLSGWMLLALSGPAFAVSASPVAPPGAEGLQDLLNWTLYGGAIACAGTAMFGFAKMGISHSQQSFQGANHGKSVAILGLLGALGLGLTPTIVNGLTAIH